MTTLLADIPLGAPRLIGPEQAAGAPLPWFAIGVVVLAVLALALSYHKLFRVGIGKTDPERAFDALCRRYRLRGESRRLLTMLADRTGVEPVALLISEHAYRAAITPAPNEGGQPGPALTVFERRRLTDISSKLHGGSIHA